MKIGIHAQAFSVKNLTGIGYFALDLIEAINEVDQSHDYCLFSSLPLQHLPKGDQIRVVQKKPHFAFSYIGFPLGIKEEQCDLAFFPRQGGSPLINKPQVIYIHDLYVFRNSLHFKIMHKYFFAKAVVILTNSMDTKREIVEKCRVKPEKVNVVYPGYNPKKCVVHPKEKIEQVLEKHHISSPYFLNASSLWWQRKNLLRLIEAFGHFCKKQERDYQLVITGNPGIGDKFHKSDHREMIHLINRENLENRVKLLQYIPKEDLYSLYCSAEALVFPSLHEGFGIPVIEAMALGCPVITSHISALPEVAGEAGIFVDPFSIKSIEEGMTKMVNDCKMRENLIEKGRQRAQLFTREKMARSFLDIISKWC